MKRKGKGYLTIGEISKVTGIHPKSIRYYERIGILSPAEIDPENGYRYYSPTQVHHLFAIKTCIHFGLPLKNFPKYCHNGTMYTSRYLEDAAAQTREKIQDLESKLAYLEGLQAHVQQSDRLMAEKQIVPLEQKERTFLVQEVSPDQDARSLFQTFATLFSETHRLGLPTAFLCGRIARFRQGKLEKLYAAVLLARKPNQDAQILTLPEATCQALYTTAPNILQAPELFSGDNLLVLETSCIASEYQEGAPGYVLRCIHE